MKENSPMKWKKCAVFLLIMFILAAGTAFSAAPTITTNDATSVGSTSAVINATVNPGGLATKVKFQYSTEAPTPFGWNYTNTTAESEAGSGTTDTDVSASVIELASETTYYFRAVATNDDGSKEGMVKSFKTAAPNSAPAKPSLSLPSNGSTASVTPELKTGAFSDPDTGDIHAKTLWEISTVNNFASTVVSETSTSSLTSFTVPSSTLTVDTTYYWRVKFYDDKNNGSEYSDTWQFTASKANSAPVKPTLTSPINNATGVSATPTLQTAAFSDADGDAHTQSEWDISTVSSFDYLVYHYTTSTDLVSLTVPDSILHGGKTYYWRVKHYSDQGSASEWSDPFTFTTAATGNNAPDSPTLTLPENAQNNVSLAPTLETSAFSDPDSGDTHAYTEWEIAKAAPFTYNRMLRATTDFTYAMFHTKSSTYLTSISLPEGILDQGTLYYWRARHYDNNNNASHWSQIYSFTTLTIKNDPPYSPTITYPVNGTTDIPLQPTVTTDPFSDADGADTHYQTEWEISTVSDFSFTIFHMQTGKYLTSIPIPQFVLTDGVQYYIRARFYDNHSNKSDWSSTIAFTTETAFQDDNKNGILDSQENDTIDLDNDGVLDTQQNNIKSLNTAVGSGQIGLSSKESSTITGIDAIQSVDPDAVSQVARPHQLPLGLLAFRVKVKNPGDAAQIRIYFSEAAPAGTIWYKYDSVKGFIDYSAYATFAEDRMSVVLRLKDGGYGDADGKANGIIVDPGGFGLATWIEGVITDASTNRGISNATVTIGTASLKTDRDGSYVTPMLPGNYTMSVTATGYDTQTFTELTLSEGSTVTKDVALTGGQGGNVSLNATSNDYGTFSAGASSSKTYTITNTGGSDLTIGTLTITGTNASEFAIKNDNCSGKTIGSGKSATFDVAFYPATSGSKTASVSIPSNDPDMATASISLTGSATGVTSGNMATTDLWIRAVINTEEKGPIDAIWYKGGDATTSSNDRVIWGYFYADPNQVTWGSKNNPDLYVKIWFDHGGRLDVNYFHVSVPDIVVYSDYVYDGSPDQQGTATTSRRYIRHYFEGGQSGSSDQSEDGIPASGYTQTGTPPGFSTINDLKIGAVINTEDKGGINAVWFPGGTDKTDAGHEVVWGYFYANPNDVSWGNKENPDLFVKVWFDAGGRVDVNFFHVSVPDIEVYSDLPTSGDYDQKGTTIMADRYIRHEYTTTNK